MHGFSGNSDRTEAAECQNVSVGHWPKLVEVTAHKLVPDQTIRVHNDYIVGGESHRLLLQLNRGWEPSNGGYLMFFGGPEPETVSEVIEPINGSVQAFSISPRSYHAVSTVHRGERFTVVYSFYPDSGCG